MVPNILFSVKRSCSKFLERLAMVPGPGSTPSSMFESNSNLTNCVQFVNEDKKDQSPASSRFLPRSNSTKLGRVPKEGTTPWNALSRRLTTTRFVPFASEMGI
uniref:Uncharacterized protein n=1 Tax=Oryza glumipatula TaxID=40148 RepID=A0A0E0ABA0_9ORYZ